MNEINSNDKKMKVLEREQEEDIFVNGLVQTIQLSQYSLVVQEQGASFLDTGSNSIFTPEMYEQVKVMVNQS